MLASLKYYTNFPEADANDVINFEAKVSYIWILIMNRNNIVIIFAYIPRRDILKIVMGLFIHDVRKVFSSKRVTEILLCDRSASIRRLSFKFCIEPRRGRH